MERMFIPISIPDGANLDMASIEAVVWKRSGRDTSRGESCLRAGPFSYPFGSLACMPTAAGYVQKVLAKTRRLQRLHKTFPSTAPQPPNHPTTQLPKLPLLWVRRSIAHMRSLHRSALLVSQRTFFANRTHPEGIACPSLAVSPPYCLRNPLNAIAKGILFTLISLLNTQKVFAS
jgi:hypothetical protein